MKGRLLRWEGMKANEFEVLSKEDKVKLVQKYGEFLEEIQHYNLKIFLYHIGTLLVEIHFSPHLEKVIEVNLANNDRLPDFSRVDISSLI
ncbi:hypothetical protein [Flexithrix dorotheae]|uniref:hypothetical protein n=1 Tax=Flexithrix dorotheae TaxID=70993 RepID=UPI000378EC39|nr:hypothetical protein [Flexithrix dorotheae]